MLLYGNYVEFYYLIFLVSFYVEVPTFHSFDYHPKILNDKFHK